MSGPFAHLRPFSYGLIMADPPWSFDNWSAAGEAKNAKAHYGCMSLDDIKALPVGELAAGDAVLWLWATNPMLPQAFEVMAAWGFAFKTAGHWVKRAANGGLAFGTGYVLRSAGEPFLIGTVGKPRCARNVRSVIEGDVPAVPDDGLTVDALRGAHSAKPDEAFTAAEMLAPGPYLEVFSRRSRPGWDAWGDEAGKFDGAAA